MKYFPHADFYAKQYIMTNDKPWGPLHKTAGESDRLVEGPISKAGCFKIRSVLSGKCHAELKVRQSS